MDAIIVALVAACRLTKIQKHKKQLMAIALNETKAAFHDCGILKTQKSPKHHESLHYKIEHYEEPEYDDLNDGERNALKDNGVIAAIKLLRERAARNNPIGNGTMINNSLIALKKFVERWREKFAY
jgi:hypothetical protein